MNPKDKAGVEVTSSCAHRGHVLFQGQSRLLLFFWYFMKAAASQVNVFKCQVMICIMGCDPKKIWHATLVSCQKKGEWLKMEEVGMDKEKRGEGEGPNLSNSHDQQITQIAGGSLCPHPLQCMPWWMGHLILPCLRVLLECICPSQNTKTTLVLRRPGHKLLSIFKIFWTLSNVLNKAIDSELFEPLFLALRLTVIDSKWSKCAAQRKIFKLKTLRPFPKI